VQWVNQLANLYSSRELNCFYNKNYKTLPWITHTMVTQVQIVISSLAKISKSYLHHNSLKRQQPLHVSILRVTLKTFNDVIDDIKRSIQGSGLGCFVTPPPSYVSLDLPPLVVSKNNPPFTKITPLKDLKGVKVGPIGGPKISIANISAINSHRSTRAAP